MSDPRVIFEPRIDAQNPPVGVDSVLVAEGGTGSVRLSCFSGNPYIEREEEKTDTSEGKTIRRWVRPVAVLDIGYGAVRYIEGYLLYRLSQRRGELKRVLLENPELLSMLKSELEAMEGARA